MPKNPFDHAGTGPAWFAGPSLFPGHGVHPAKGPFTGDALSFQVCLCVWEVGPEMHSVDFGINEDVGED